jgi:hypothetical protein
MHLRIAPAAALQLWRTVMGHSMKKLLVIVALTTALVARLRTGLLRVLA